MHQGRPYGLHVIGGKLTDKDVARINSAAVRFTNLKELSQVESLKLVYDLPDGGSFIIQDMGGNFRVIAHKPQHEEKYFTDGKAQSYIPMLFSAAMEDRTWTPIGRGIVLTLTTQTRQRLLGYTGNLAPRVIELRRFACPYNRKFSEFIPMGGPALNYVQYGKQRPTWYSGTMAELMQIVGGYGYQDLSVLPQDNIYEQAKFELPKDKLDLIEDYLKSYRLPAYTGVPHSKGSFQCEYSYTATDVVGFDITGEPWLVRINKAGVWAMPLPIIPATRTRIFRDYIIEVGDDEILPILDRFGAMPSGETFPDNDSHFQAWYRAGVIIKVCGTGDFYQHSGHSTAMGWSINDKGTEAVNTCYDFDDSENLFYGLAYKIKLDLGACDNKGWASNEVVTNLAGEFAAITQYLNSLYDFLDIKNPIHAVVKYKITKSNISDISDRAIATKGVVTENEVNYWNNLVVEPIAIHKGSIREISRGYIYDGNIIKVPEPYADGCVSLGVQYNQAPVKTIKSDVIVLAYYIGNEMKTVRYFSDIRNVTPTVKDNYEKCMIVGQWRRVEKSGDGGIRGNVYMSDVDDREPISALERTTVIKGKDLGYTKPSFRHDFYFSVDALLWRTRYYTTQTNITESLNTGLSIAALMPFYTRNCAIYVKEKTVSSGSSSERLELNQVTDPNQYGVWSLLYNEDPNLDIGRQGRPISVKGRPVWADTVIRQAASDCSYFADEGPWLGGLPYDVTEIMYGGTNIVWALEIVTPPPPVATYFRETPSDKQSEYETKCSMYNRIDLIHTKLQSQRYYRLSPIPSDGSAFDIDACKVMFGSVQYANIKEEKQAGGRYRWGDSSLVNHLSAHHFIGVINE